jgi:hypothetical protein
MRVSRESLIRIAKETSQERAYNDPTIVAAYLTGSLVSGADPMLGGTTDIDLVFVHNSPPALSRQIMKLTPDFHLDIRHRSKSEFRSPRELRTDPLLGWELYNPMLLLQRDTFFDFFQAGLRAGFEFHTPSLVLARCRKLHAAARSGWMDLMEVVGEKAGAQEVKRYLLALADTANTVAELNGGPLGERRLLMDFPARAQAAERPDFTAALFNLIGAGQVDSSILAKWLEPWKSAFLAAAEVGKVDVRIHAARLNYYEKAIRSLLEGDTPLGGLWPLILTWTLAVGVLDEPMLSVWSDACRQLGLLGPALNDRVSGLDKYLDDVEIRLDEIAAANGLETSMSI